LDNDTSGRHRFRDSRRPDGKLVLVADSRLDTLVELARTGAESALTQLYREFQPALVGFLAGLASGEAEDLAAETWIAMARYLPRFDGNGRDFRRVLFTVARRRAIDHIRKQRRRRTDPTDGGELLGRAAADDPAQTVSNLDGTHRAVQTITALLPRSQAEVVLLRVVAGLSVAEVARVVNRPAAAVSVLQTRGLRRLATGLGNPTESLSAPRPS
jgi:RNA polymerase sigma-70 factor (ECF subfamily)